MSRVLNILRSFWVKCMEPTKTTIAVYSLRRACCRRQHSVMQVSTLPDTKSRGLVGSLSLELDFIFNNCNTSHPRINLCVHFFRSSVGKYVQFPSSGWYHLIRLAVLSNSSWLFHLFPYCLVHQECFPRYKHASHRYMLFMVVPIINLLIYIFILFDLPFIISKKKKKRNIEVPKLATIFHNEIML